MKNTQSLKLSRDFRRVYKGNSYAGKYIVVYARRNRYSFNRLGLTVSTSVGKAVVRNRLKRLMRESYRLIEDEVRSGYDIILVSRRRALGKTMSQIKDDVGYAMKKLDIKK